MKYLNIYIFFIFVDVTLLKKLNPKSKPKCCIGTENFGINLYSTGVSCSDMINCCPSGSICSFGKCILINKKRRRRITRSKKDFEKKNINDKDEGPTFKKGDEIIKPIKIEKQPTFSGPVKINWKTFTKCLKESGSKEQVILDIISDYKNKKENNAMKKVFSELKNKSPLIIECLNKQEHLVK